MLLTKRKPVTVGEILLTEFMNPLALSQYALAAAMDVPPDQIEDLCNNRQPVAADQANSLARVFGNTPEFWLKTQRRTDQWTALHQSRQ